MADFVRFKDSHGDEYIAPTEAITPKTDDSSLVVQWNGDGRIAFLPASIILDDFERAIESPGKVYRIGGGK